MTDETAISALLRRADAYAHTEYYGKGLADCLADNREFAEEASRDALHIQYATEFRIPCPKLQTPAGPTAARCCSPSR